MQTEIVKIDPESFSSSELDKAGRIIREGGLVAFPTETVYGLGASGLSDSAAEKIYAAKGRPQNNPLILHFSSPRDCEEYIYTDDRFYKLAEAFMPGPLTVVMKSKGKCSPSITAGLDTLAVRVPRHPVAREMIKAAGVPVAAPSANLSGKPSTTAPAHVISDLSGKVDMIIDGGDAEIGLESTIIKLTDGGAVLLRPGEITVEMLSSVIGRVEVAQGVLTPPKCDDIVESPGMLFRHYSPTAPLFLIRTADKEKRIAYMQERYREGNTALIAYTGEIGEGENIYPFGSYGDKDTQAKNLFALLRLADKEEIKRIYAPCPTEEGLSLALLNRMLRAAAFRIIDLD